MQLNWIFKKFDELTAAELYSIMQLRNEVFVVEQNCVYQDADDKDQKSFHLCGWDEGKLVAYTRIIPQGISYAEASIGRVVTSPAELYVYMQQVSLPHNHRDEKIPGLYHRHPDKHSFVLPQKLHYATA